ILATARSAWRWLILGVRGSARAHSRAQPTARRSRPLASSSSSAVERSCLQPVRTGPVDGAPGGLQTSSKVVSTCRVVAKGDEMNAAQVAKRSVFSNLHQDSAVGMTAKGSPGFKEDVGPSLSREGLLECGVGRLAKLFLQPSFVVAGEKYYDGSGLREHCIQDL